MITVFNFLVMFSKIELAWLEQSFTARVLAIRHDLFVVMHDSKVCIVVSEELFMLVLMDDIFILELMKYYDGNIRSFISHDPTSSLVKLKFLGLD